MLQPHTRAISTPGQDVDDERAQLQAWITGEADELIAADPLPPERFSAPVLRRDLDRGGDAANQFLFDPPWGDLARVLEPDASPSESLPPPHAPATSGWRALGTTRTTRTTRSVRSMRSMRSMRSIKDLAIKMRAWCAVHPPLDDWSRLWFVLPMLGLLAAGIAWGPRPEDLRTLAAYMPESVARFVSLRASPSVPQGSRKRD